MVISVRMDASLIPKHCTLCLGFVAGEVLAQCEAMKASFKRWIKYVNANLADFFPGPFFGHWLHDLDVFPRAQSHHWLPGCHS
jgi:hypothetical protein